MKPRSRGHPRTGLGPEYQEAVRLARSGATPRDIERQLGKAPGWARSALQWLRSQGALGPETRAGPGRPRTRPPRPRRLVLQLEPELAAALDRARGETDLEEWALAVLAEAAGK